MSNAQYNVEVLQDLDDQCRALADKMGLELPVVHFHLCQAEEIYDIAARSLPGRYSHYQFGRNYEQQKGDYDRGRGRIYELVINTLPVNAYLLDGNGLMAQLLVIAHVYGHSAVFEHSAYFKPADKNILARVRSAAERIDGYIGEYGRECVEDFIDSVEALEYQRSFDLLGKPVLAKPPEWETKKFDMLFPEETATRRGEYVEQKEEFRTRFPKQPERDLLAFLEKHSRRLEDWQRDIISIIRTECEYFVPMMRTQVINEATAVYYHMNIVQEIMAGDQDTWNADDVIAFNSMNASVLHPKISYVTEEGDPWKPEYAEDGLEPYVACVGINPYLTGHVIFGEVKRICEDPTEKEKERWPHWAGITSWEEKRNELIQTYDDAALLAEFLSPKVCEKAKLFMRNRTLKEYKDLRVLKDECEEVRKVLVEAKTFMSPIIEITDADYHNRGELLMIHHPHNNLGLDNEYAKGTLRYMADLWGHPVVIKTLAPRSGEEDPEEELPTCWYRCEPGEEPTRDTQEPS